MQKTIPQQHRAPKARGVLYNSKIHGTKAPQLLFRFFVDGLLPAPLAEFLKLDLTFNKFLVLARPVVDALAISARKFNKLFLCHMRGYYTRFFARVNFSYQSANSIPRAEITGEEGFHNNVNKKPCRKDDHKAQQNLQEQSPRFLYHSLFAIVKQI